MHNSSNFENFHLYHLLSSSFKVLKSLLRPAAVRQKKVSLMYYPIHRIHILFQNTRVCGSAHLMKRMRTNKLEKEGNHHIYIKYKILILIKSISLKFSWFLVATKRSIILNIVLQKSILMIYVSFFFIVRYKCTCKWWR